MPSHKTAVCSVGGRDGQVTCANYTPGFRVVELVPSLVELESSTRSISRDKLRFRTALAGGDVAARFIVGPNLDWQSAEGVMGMPASYTCAQMSLRHHR